MSSAWNCSSVQRKKNPNIHRRPSLHLLVVRFQIDDRSLSEYRTVQHDDRVIPSPLYSLPLPFAVSKAAPTFQTRGCTKTLPSDYTRQRNPICSDLITVTTWIINAASAKFSVDLPPSKEITTDSKSSRYSSNSAATSIFQLSAKSLRIIPFPLHSPNRLQKHRKARVRLLPFHVAYDFSFQIEACKREFT